MNKYFYNGIITALFTFGWMQVPAQLPSFYHLSTNNGLYDNHVRSLAIDRSGYLWVGTEEGLNRYDGQHVTVFLKQKHPQLPSDYTTLLFCDSLNRTWVGTSEGLAWTDPGKKFHRILLQDTISRFSPKAIFSTSQGIILISNRGHYLFNEQLQEFSMLPAASSQLPFGTIKTAQQFSGAEALILKDSLLIRYDYLTHKIVRQWTIPNVISICTLQDLRIAVGKSTGEILILDQNTGKILQQFSLNDIPGNKMNTPDPIEIKQAANGDLIIASGLNGLVIITEGGKMSHILHDPSNPSSIIGNSIYRVVTGKTGEVVLGTSTSGVSMYNSNLSQARFKRFFADDSGNYYDNYTGNMAEQSNGIIWVAAYDRLIRWDKNLNNSSFYYYTEKTAVGFQRRDFRALSFDRTGTLWTSIDGRGIASFSEKTGFNFLQLDTAVSPAFAARAFPNIYIDNAGLIWVCTSKGVFTVDPYSRKASTTDSHPVLKVLAGKPVQSVYQDRKNRMWFATTSTGIYCYDPRANSILHFSSRNGLPSDVCYMVKEDKKGHYFFATTKGLAVLFPDGSIKTYTKGQGLRYDRCESVMIDEDDIAWVSNKNCLVRMDLSRNTINFFDEKAGLLNDGFRVGSCLKTRTGELIWGGYRGVSSFFPRELNSSAAPLRVSVPAVSTNDSVIDLSKGSSLKFKYTDNTLSFEIAGIHLGIPGKTYYQYKLTGFEKEWQSAEDISSARYTALPPGHYEFNIRASLDGLHWVAANRKIVIHIVTPLWQRGWFIILSLLSASAILYLVFRRRQKNLNEQKEELEAEQAVNYFASSLHDQQTVDAILWDVARNCIGRLNFEDCVIYLLDEKRDVLVQKAAYGPKGSTNFQVAEPLEIPLGSGITGHVAKTGEAEIIADTTKDSRYIIDDARRLSEITVPITSGNKVIGVIDCEHSKRNYFNKRHLSILTTIASLCAHKISRAKAEEEKQKAQRILSTTQQKMAEIEMQALRAQMNPHFIFNCLNSINRYIVKSDQATASLYLTRFSKLIRLILDNSGNKNVLLSNELESLKLYIEMESLRFDNKFTSAILVDTNVNQDSIEVPPLIIQPYVENAIWHGLLHKEGGGQLTISIKMIDEGMLECIIEDNGVGREKSKELKSKSATSRKSLGMQLTENRLALLNRHAELNASITIIDKKDSSNQANGTRVILRIPV